jgi:hypothetical protein
MMTDQFAVQLRRHLLDTADERPADGRLEAVVERTLGVSQRLPWIARLRWRLDPIAPFNNPWLRYGAVALSLLILAAVSVVAFAGTNPRAPVFEGTWTSTDTADGSTQTLVVGPGTDPTVHFEDDFSVNCQNRAERVTRYRANATGHISGGRLMVDFVGGCTQVLPVYPAFYEFDAATGTLLDYQSIRWVRVP